MSSIKKLIFFIQLILCFPCISFAVTESCVEARDWLNRGLLLHDGSQKEILFYKKAVQLCPDLIAAYNRIGEIYKKRGETELAQQAFSTARAKGEIELQSNKLNQNPDIIPKKVSDPYNNISSPKILSPNVPSDFIQKDFTTKDNCTVGRELVHHGFFLHDASDKEIAYYQTAVELCPELIAVYNRIGEIYKKRGEHELASHAFRLAETKSNSNAIDIYNSLIATEKKDDDAPEIFSLDQFSISGQNNEINTSYQSLSPEEYVNLPGQWSTDNCKDGRNWFHLGIFLHNDSDQEISYYKKAIELCPELTPSYSRIGEIYKRRGEFELAYYAFQMAEAEITTATEEQSPIVAKCSDARNILIDALTLSKDDPNQEIYFQRALAQCQDLSTTFETIGNIFNDNISEQPISPDCDKAKIWLQEGLNERGGLEKQAEIYHRALTLCPRMGYSFNQLGIFYQNYVSEQEFISKMDLSEQQQMSSSINIKTNPPSGKKPRYPSLNINKGLEPDNCDEGRKWYNEGIALRDNSKREASYYEKAIALCPDFAEAYNALGKVYKNHGEYDLAIKAYRTAKVKSLLSGKQALVIDPSMELGEIYRRQSKFAMAADEFKSVLEMEPESRFAQNQMEYINKRTGKYQLSTDTPEEMLTNATFTRISGLALPKGTLLTDFQIQHWVQRTTLTQDVFTEEIPLTIAPSTTETDVTMLIWGLRYGLTNRFTIGIIPMVTSRRAHLPNNTTGAEAVPEVNGISDTILMAKYLIWGIRQQHFSGYTLMSIPTGDENAQAMNAGVVRNMPMGSGSFDFTTGLSFSTSIPTETIHTSLKDMAPFTFHGNAAYRFTDGRVVGDQFTLNLALTHPVKEFISYALELNYRWRDEIRRTQFLTIFQQRPDVVGPEFDPVFMGTETIETQVIDKGGHVLFFSPSLQFELSKGFKIEIGVKIPFLTPDSAVTEDLVYHLGVTKFIF